jgi:hypothetical protein
MSTCETHACNPSYLGGRDQEDCSSKPAWVNSLRDSYLEKTHHKKRAGRMAQGSNLSTAQKKKKIEIRPFSLHHHKNQVKMD